MKHTLLLAIIVFGSLVQAAKKEKQPEVNLHAAREEMLALPQGAEMPVELLKKYDSRTLARGVVDRVRQREYDPNAPEVGYYDFWKDSTIMMVFHERRAHDIGKNGFRNNSEVTRQNHAIGYDLHDVHEAISGLTFPNIPESWELMPKYAYVQLDYSNPNVWRNRLDVIYGNVVAVFKDHIKDQATFTPGNSWVIREGAHSFAYKTATPFPEPHYELSYGVSASWGHHFETQIWGKLTLDDVDHFLVKCPRFGGISGEGMQGLYRLGKPIFLCENDPANSVMIKGAQIFCAKGEFDGKTCKRFVHAAPKPVAPAQAPGQ